ncbi:hypothetical protein WJX81_005109 [Elliptochloris bilobata]|uniref:Uncharacterized protein n=1 Tax=Elliptochloris bilobata TaxID=381761 RepID=A0AAW1RR99_9CHLO
MGCRTEPRSYGGGNSGAYAVVAVLQAGLALPMYLCPHETAEFLFGAAALPHIALHVPLARLLAVGLVASAGGALGLMGAAERQDLNRRVFQRLNLSLLALAGTAAALEALYLPIFTPAGLAAGAFVSLPALLVSAVHYQRTSGHGANPLPVLAGAAKSVAQLASIRDSSARLYSLLTAAIAGAGIAYLLAPQSSLAAVFGPPGSLGWAPSRLDVEVLWRMLGGALLSLTPWTYSLKGGAEANLLWRRPFPLLNAGLTLVAAAHVLLLGPLLITGECGKWLPAVFGTWGLALCTFTYHWLKNIGPK